MNVIKEHIKNNRYKQVYLLYGGEAYLKRLYRDKLKEGIIGDGDTMNFSYFEGKDADALKIRSIAETMPFFGERRLIVIENSNWFKNQTDFGDYIREVPETTVLIFVESEIDKRGKLFKAVKELGYASEMNGMEFGNLKLFAASLFRKGGKKVSEEAVNCFLDTVGHDMNTICNEADKLISYTLGKELVEISDIQAVCTELIQNRIFSMIDAIGGKNGKKALDMYFDLVILREKPLSILFLIIRHFNLLLQVKELSSIEKDHKVIAAKVSVPPFTVGKYLTQAKNFTSGLLKDALGFGIEVEEMVKTGRLDEKMAVEFMIMKYSSPGSITDNIS